MTFVASAIIALVTLAVVLAVVGGVVLAVGAARSRRQWRVETGPITSTGPDGELQNPQYADRGTITDGGDDAGDTVIAVVGTGITPFTNRAPLSVPRSERSQRHG